MVIDPISLEVGKIVIKTAWEGGGKILGWLGGNLTDETKQLIFQASQQYWQNYQDRHCLLKVLGMREPVRLESIYTEVQFLGDRDILNFTSVDSLEKAFRETAQRSYQRQHSSKQAGLQAAKDKQYLMVLGSPGSGKSTFLRRIDLEAFKGSNGNYPHGCLPVQKLHQQKTSKKVQTEQPSRTLYSIPFIPNSQFPVPCSLLKCQSQFPN
jgi:hypothetical protein